MKNQQIAADVISGLREYYAELKQPEFADALQSSLVKEYRDTGNDQADYERLRDLAEFYLKLCEKMHGPKKEADFTFDENRVAWKQGWGIFNCNDSGAPLLEIRSVVDVPEELKHKQGLTNWGYPFKTNAEARAFVAMQAIHGESLALKAVQHLADHARRGEYRPDPEKTSQETYADHFPAFAYLM